MGDTFYFNINFIIVRLYQIITGLPVGDIKEVPGALLFWGGQLALLGTAISVVLAILITWARIKLLTTEHEGFHHKEALEHEMSATVELSTAKNPRWDNIMALASSSNESDWRRAILDADTMLGDMLTEKGYSGEGIGEQLKLANPLQFTTLDLAWQAHKTRNMVAHLGEGFELSERETRATIDQFARVFEEFGLI